MKKGEKIYLTAVEREDLHSFMNWRNTEKFKKNFREYLELNIDSQNRWYENKVLNDLSTIMFSIRRKSDDKLLGCTGLCYINWIHRHADLSLYIGHENAYIDEEGYAEESCNLLFEYGFLQLGLNKIWTEIYEFDYKKKKLLLRLGFHLDGVLRKNYYYDGRWNDSIVLSLLNEEWKSEFI